MSTRRNTLKGLLFGAIGFFFPGFYKESIVASATSEKDMEASTSSDLHTVEVVGLSHFYQEKKGHGFYEAVVKDDRFGFAPLRIQVNGKYPILEKHTEDCVWHHPDDQRTSHDLFLTSFPLQKKSFVLINDIPASMRPRVFAVKSKFKIAVTGTPVWSQHIGHYLRVSHEDGGHIAIKQIVA